MKLTAKQISGESREIIDDIRRLVQAIRLSSGESEKRVGLSAAQLFVLNKLGEEKGLSINDLAERTLTHQSSVSVIVQKLEAKKLVKRSVSQEDARKFKLFLTKKGAALVKKAPQSIQEQMINGLVKMKPGMRKEFALGFSAFLLGAGISGKAPLLFAEDSAKKKVLKK